MGKSLVIVESPTKAKTLKRFLGDEYIVESSVGHVRDLPSSAEEIPAKIKEEWGKEWARLGVNVEDDFAPLYIVSPEKKKKITELKKYAKEVDQILLATDEDREGEAISWHLNELLKPKNPPKRMVFHEITKSAILAALEHTREIDSKLVDAQETRRIIDRLYGYLVSPILWRKIAPKLSAGRVQSVAVRMIVEREQARIRFISSNYWDLSAEFKAPDGKTFPAKVLTIEGRRLASGKSFDPDSGSMIKPDQLHLQEPRAVALRDLLQTASYRVISAEEKPFSKRPAPPFTTSTLQQEGNRKLRFNAKRTMRAAQRLYENGFITYMRTDATTLSTEAVDAARTAIKDLYGDEFLPDEPRTYTKKVKNAQEAHEAIRPAHPFKPISEVESALGPDETKVYELIWKRTMACQMPDARGRRMVAKISTTVDGQEVVFQANGNVIDFPGFLRAYVEGSDDPDAELADKETILPPLKEQDPVEPVNLTADGHDTQPPARLTEASLVKALEESGVGRPSTYASIIDTIQRRYTFKKGNALVPTFVAFAVVRLMREHLGHLVDLTFTASMEERLDQIARGEQERLPYLKEFYFGNGVPGLQPLLEKKQEVIDARMICSVPLGEHPDNKKTIWRRVGRYGPYVQLGDDGDRANVPEGLCPDELTLDKAVELLRAGAKAKEPLGMHPESGLPVYVKTGRFGPYVQLGDPNPEDKKSKPKMVSLLPEQKPEELTLAEALDLLTLPKTLGQDPDGNDVVAHFGRYGPYIKRGTDTRSLKEGDHILKIDLARALVLLAEPKARGFKREAPELKVFENVEALDGIKLRLLKGRYGPYVSDGEVNASLPRGFGDPASLTVEQAVELVLNQRAKKGKKKKKKKKKAAKKKTTKKKAKKKTTKKKATKKKAAKKKTTKKKATKKKAAKKKTAKKTSKKTAASGDDSEG